jgi:uncharacterized protein YbaA (DUF1428 family)
MPGYVDVYALPLARRKVAAYKRAARRWGDVMRDYGVLEFREFLLDDSKSRFGVPFKLKRGEVMITSVVGFKSKAHRNRANALAMKDPRMQALMKEPMLFDMKRFVMGGFRTIVEGRAAGKKRSR